MKKLLFFSTLALTLCATSVMAQTNAAATSYGKAFKEQSALSPARVQWLLKDKQGVDHVQLVGYVAEVCQKEGCWLKLSGGIGNNSEVVLVKMKDHAFAMPKDIAGKKAVVNGNIIKKMQSVTDQKHYLEDAGASKEVIDNVTEPKEVYELQATGVTIY